MKGFIIFTVLVALMGTAHADQSPSAEGLYDEGQIAYDKADYTTAIAKWQASYDLSGEVDLLFNVAQAKRLAGNCAGALATYQRFMASDADHASKQHKLAADFSRELEQCAHPSLIDSQPPLDLRLTGAEDRGRPRQIAGIATGAGGVALIATGLILGHHAQMLADKVTAACRLSCDWSAQKDKDAAGRSDATIGRVLDVAGAVGIVGGVVMYYVGMRDGELTVSPKSREGGAVVTWSGSW